MIFVKNWRKYYRNRMGYTDYKGVFLFGFIPLYIEMIGSN